ncbi:type II toxin-antitoxin system RnlA family toxin [Sebaldella termitidis]|uniref:type II toxin-antitoxin system RnlA family toxin n=1 Tax=Sebaldella termitidis TaxID=826 RepID=UPI003EBA99C2
MATKENKTLNLDREKIRGTIENFCTANGYTLKSEEKGNHTVHKILNLPLRIYYKKDGTTTLDASGLSDEVLKENIIAKIKDECLLSQENNKSIRIGSLDESDIDLLMDFLNDEYGQNIHVNIKENTTSKIYQFTEKIQNSKVTLTHYSNGTCMLQGKPLVLLFNILQYFQELGLVEFKTVIKEITGKNPVQNHEGYIQQNYPHTYRNLHPNAKKLYFTIFELRDSVNDLSDYGVLAFPSMRFLEFALKDILMKKGGISVGKVFTMFDGGTCTLQPAHASRMNCAQTQNNVEKMYSVLKVHRHGICHTEQIDAATVMLSSKNSTLTLINDTLKLIENSYEII